MFGEGKDGDERFWNFMLFKIPMNNKEMEDSMVFAGIVIVGLLALIVWAVVEVL